MNELHVGDKVYTTKSEILEGFREHFHNLATPSDDKSFDQSYSDQIKLEVNEIQEMCSKCPEKDVKQITLDQVKEAISSLNTNKAATYMV